MNENLITETIDNGCIENVHISPIGEFTGSDSKGNPVPESITKESLEAIALKLNSSEDEVLADVDHQSMRPGTEKDSKAAGWFSKFFVDPVKGLFAKLNLTKWGKELLENREYRFVSPTFYADENGCPTDIHSISLTNTPAFKGFIDPILNTESIKNEKDILDMTKEELKEIIKETIFEVKAEKEAAEAKEEEEVKEDKEVMDACAKNEEAAEVKEDKQVIEEAKAAETVSENACAKNEEVVEEKKVEETEVEEEKKPEVIKIEALNSAPVPEIKAVEKWRSMTPAEFTSWFNNGMK